MLTTRASVAYLVAALQAAVCASAAAGDLFSGAVGAVPEGPPSLRARLVTADLDQVPNWTDAVGATVSFNLWSGTTLTGSVERGEPTDAGQVLSGTLLDEPDGSFILVTRQGVMVAEIRSPSGGAWYVHPAAGGTHAVRQINDEAFAPCAVDAAMEIHPPAGPAKPPQAFDPRATPEVAVMIVYTAQARDGAGGQSEIDAIIDLAISQANQTYTNSQVNAKLKLVYRGLVNYTESGSASTDIYRLQDPFDGYIDEVHAIRDCVGADVVSMFVNNFNACGIGFLMCCGGYPGFESNAFNVVDKDCITNFSFAHEVGHNLGCHHDRDNAGGGAAFSYAYGYRTPNQIYRTVMAYQPGTRIGYFSNPNVSYQGYVLGVPLGQPTETHNALAISNTAPIAAGFRPDACPSDIDQNCFVNGEDFDLFSAWFIAGDIRADYDGNSFVNGDDFDSFALDFSGGC